MPPLMLHSLTFYADLIERLAALPACPDVVEIGSESGEMSVRLATAAARRGGSLYVVEPAPSELLRAFAAEHSNVVVVEGYSPEALAGLPPAGLYVVDGDHNYVTVRGEVEAIFAASSQGGPRGAIAVMHDVGWPSGRRDQYYAPDRLPAEAVWPHSFTRGATLDSTELTREGRGFRGEGAFAFALHEGGPRNGVRTAIEDVLAADPSLAMLTTPMVFGLGVIGDKTHPQWSDIETLMAPYVGNPTLEAAERNRLDLLLHVIELQDLEAERLTDEAERTVISMRHLKVMR
ncbi:MAG: hypothetical protein QOD07_1923 [Frankiaceae bacterium]|jgi:hypothetical protein|nr:hypothetical protein [Frankiaceae bacterium]